MRLHLFCSASHSSSCFSFSFVLCCVCDCVITTYRVQNLQRQVKLLTIQNIFLVERENNPASKCKIQYWLSFFISDEENEDDNDLKNV